MKTTNNMEDYFTTKEALYELNHCISMRTLYRFIDRGILQKYKFGGRTLLLKSEVCHLKPTIAKN